jgi:CRP-like cAMP-binding protein
MFSKRYINGFYIVYSGRCEIENPSGFNGYYLTAGDYFGESLMFEAKGFNNFGRIKAVDPKVECLLLSRHEFNKIPSLDVLILIT